MSLNLELERYAHKNEKSDTCWLQNTIVYILTSADLTFYLCNILLMSLYHSRLLKNYVIDNNDEGSLHSYLLTTYISVVLGVTAVTFAHPLFTVHESQRFDSYKIEMSILFDFLKNIIVHTFVTLSQDN